MRSNKNRMLSVVRKRKGIKKFLPVDIHNCLFVDPGDYTALALFKRKKSPYEVKNNITIAKRVLLPENEQVLNDRDLIPKVHQFSIHESRVEKGRELAYLWSMFQVFLNKYRPYKVYIEDVELWKNSVKSITSAKRGNLFKLSRLVGVYEYLAAKTIGYQNVSLIKPTTWKAQLRNDTLQKWIVDIIGVEYKTDHVCCAVGLGLWKAGYI